MGFAWFCHIFLGVASQLRCPIHVQAWNREKKRLYDVGLHLPSQGTDEKHLRCSC